MGKKNRQSRQRRAAAAAQTESTVESEQAVEHNVASTRASINPFWIAMVLVVLTVIAYSSVPSFDFINLDDPQYITENEVVKRGLSAEGIHWAFTTGTASNWHPVTWLSHMLDVSLFGETPGAHHVVNLLFHIINGLLLFALLRSTTGTTWRSAAVAALFALHPLHVESVTWIAERKDVLSTFFLLTTLWAYVWYVRHRSFRNYALMALSLVLGLMSKPMLVTLPCVLLLFDIWPLNRLDPARFSGAAFGRLVVEKLPLFALVIVSAWITVLVQSDGGAISSLGETSIGMRLSNALLSYVLYIKMMFWPTDLALLYPFPQTIPVWQPLLCAGLLLGVSLFAVRQLKQHPWFAVGWFWYLGTLVPVIGLVQVGTQAMADRYTYITLIGLFVVLVWGAHALLRPWHAGRSAVALAATLPLLAGLVAMTWAQNQHWKNGRTIWAHTLNVTGDNYRAEGIYGAILAEKGELKEAVTHFRRAVTIEPRYVEAHNRLGVALSDLGQPADALKHFEVAVQRRPEFALAHTNYANALAATGKTDDAVARYREAIRLDPTSALALNGLGSALDDRGDVDGAIEHYRQALVLKPGLAAAHNNLAAAFAKKGDASGAASALRAAISAAPRNPRYHLNLGMLMAQTGDQAMARQHLENALAINPRLESARQALASLSPQQSSTGGTQ